MSATENKTGETNDSAENEDVKTPITEPTGTEGVGGTDTAPESEPPKRRRGRPPGAKAKPKPKKTIYGGDEIGIMGRQLVGVHQIVAMVTGIPEIQIQEQEGALLAQSIANVANEYGLEIDGKTGASVQLFMTVAMIYGPRFLQFRARAKSAQQSNDVTIPTN